MGCAASSTVNGPVYMHMTRTFADVISAMRMTKDEVDVLYNAWDKVDANKDAFMSIEEFHLMLGMKQNNITKRVFAMLDRNGSSEVDFGEWLASIWVYLSFSRMSLIGLAFQLIDMDGNGMVDDEETLEFVKDMANSPLSAKEKLVDWADLTKDWKAAANISDSMTYTDPEAFRRSKTKGKAITDDIFARYALRNPSILYGALMVQTLLREKIGGKTFWLKATEKRAGKAEVAQVTQFYDSIRIDVRQQHLLEALITMKDGWVSAEVLAPNGDMERIRDVWARTYGAGKRALLLSRDESMKVLQDARVGSSSRRGIKTSSVDNKTMGGKKKSARSNTVVPDRA